MQDQRTTTRADRVTNPDLFPKTNAKILKAENIASNGSVVLLHFNRHVDYIIWFWSVIAAGAVPTISTPLPTDPTVRLRHLNHVQTLLNHPKIITSQGFLQDFVGVESPDLFLVENIVANNTVEHTNGHTNGYTNGYTNGHDLQKPRTDLAFLMLTSGSTGNAKAVEECHDRVIAAVKGKSNVFGTTHKDIFFNWIGE